MSHSNVEVAIGQRCIVLLAILSLVTLIVLVAEGSLAQTPPPNDGDWDIYDATVISDRAVTVRGNVTVHDSGSLTLTNVDLRLNLTYHGAFHVLVASGGTLTVSGGSIDSLDGATRFNISLLGTATIGGCLVQRLDGADAPTPLGEPSGLVVRSSSVRIHNTTVAACGGFALAVQPAGISDISPVIEDCTLRNNGGGIYCGGIVVAAANPTVRDCAFYGNGLAEALIIAAHPIFVECTFGRLGALSLTGASAAGLAEPTFRDCTFQWLGMAFNSVLADPTMVDCQVSACGLAINVLGGDATIRSTSISNCPVAMTLNSTTATVVDCSVTGFATPGYAITIDAGRPTLRRLDLDLTLIGGGVQIINGSGAEIVDSTLMVTSGLDVISVTDSRPKIKNCTLADGEDGVDLTWSEAVIEKCTIENNAGWGVISRYARPTTRSNTFGTDAQENVEGRILFIYWLEVHVEYENGTPAQGANVIVTNNNDVEVIETVTNETGFAFSGMVPDYVLTNAGRGIEYSPYILEATLGNLSNTTRVDVDTNPSVVLVLRPPPNMPPRVGITSPVDGDRINVWDDGGEVPLYGTVTDPEGGRVSWTWEIDGEEVPGLELIARWTFEVGEHSVVLVGTDDHGDITRVQTYFTVFNEPPASNYARIISPDNGAVFEWGAPVDLYVEYEVWDDPTLPVSDDLPIKWTSNLDGLILTARNGTLATLSPGLHLIEVEVHPRTDRYISEPYTDSVVIQVLPPDPVAVAVIASPMDMWEIIAGEVMLSAEGSSVEIWDGEDVRVIYRWSSDLDGALGEAMEMTVTIMTVGRHVITLEVLTEPFVVGDTASVSIIVHPDPNDPPHARLTVLTVSAVAGEPINLTAAGSADPNGDELTYTWDLGDGNTSSTIAVSHVYEEAGNYTVLLTVSDGQFEVTTEALVEVAPAPDPGPGPGPGPDPGPGDGNGDDDDGPQEPSDELAGWLLIILLVLGIVLLLYIAWRGQHRAE